MTLPKEHLEDEIWSLIRMSPENYHLRPKMLPSFSHLRLKHQNGVPKCDSVNRKATNDTSCYTLEYKS
jgi:hypothetical protein